MTSSLTRSPPALLPKEFGRFFLFNEMLMCKNFCINKIMTSVHHEKHICYNKCINKIITTMLSHCQSC